MIITKTPLRVSFAGGGTDLKDYYSLNGGGKVFSTAIDKYVYVIIKERFDKKIRVGYTKTELVNNINEIQHDLVRECLRKTGVTEGVEIVTMADIPSEGSGLGSSSSITVGLLNAMYSHKGKNQSPEKLARDACEIEIDILGKPIGKQDQYIAAYGNMQEIMFHPEGRVSVKRVILEENVKLELNKRLMLYFSGITRNANNILSEQKRNIPQTMDQLDKIRDMVDQIIPCLSKKSSLDEVGRILHQGWKTKRKLASKVSNEKIDGIYKRALNAGAIGGKVLGAGGGGFILFYCLLEKQSAVREELKHLQEIDFHFESNGSKVIFNIQ